MVKGNTLMTVILATYNRCEDLKIALSTLIEQDTDGTFDYEVMVIDNNSTDETRKVVESFMSMDPRVKYFHEPKQGKSHAMNKGVALASGEFLCFTDDDVRVDALWMFNIKRCFFENDCDAIGGRVLPIYPLQTPQWVKDNIDILRGAIISYDFGEETMAYAKPMYEFIGANFAIRKKAIEDTGSFRSDLGVGGPYMGEDTEYINRLEKNNKKLYYCGGALVWHPLDLNRTKLSFIAKWCYALGRYRVFTSDYKTLPDNLVYYFGVPRYLLLEMSKTILGLLSNIFVKREFLKHWIRLSLDRGRAFEIRLLRTKEAVRTA
jgi:glycosyltransferase involved in cell wall biosynthesis